MYRFIFSQINLEWAKTENLFYSCRFVVGRLNLGVSLSAVHLPNIPAVWYFNIICNCLFSFPIHLLHSVLFFLISFIVPQWAHSISLRTFFKCTSTPLGECTREIPESWNVCSLSSPVSHQQHTSFDQCNSEFRRNEFIKIRTLKKLTPV